WLLQSRLDGAGRQSGLHVAFEYIVDRRRRQRVDKSGRHQQLPGRIVRRKELAERNGERQVLFVRQQQKRVEIFVPREQQRIDADRDERWRHQRQINEAEQLQRRRAVDSRRLVQLVRQLVGRLLQHPDRIGRRDRDHRKNQRPLIIE